MFQGNLLLALSSLLLVVGCGDDGESSSDAAVGAGIDGAVGGADANANLGDLRPWTGAGPCFGGGGTEEMGSASVTIDGTAHGPFSAWITGGEPSTTTVTLCNDVGTCVGSQCLTNLQVQIDHYNSGVTPPYTGARVIADDNTKTMTVKMSGVDAGGDNQRSVSGTAQVTAWDFAAQDLAGNATVTMDTGKAVVVSWDLNGDDL